MRSWRRHIEDGRAIAVDPKCTQIVGDQPCHLPNSSGRVGRKRELHSSWKRTPLRRSQALHSPAFLVDEDETVGADGIEDIADQVAHLVGCFDIATKQDHASGSCVGEKMTFVIKQTWPSETGEESLSHVVSGRFLPGCSIRGCPTLLVGHAGGAQIGADLCRRLPRARRTDDGTEPDAALGFAEVHFLHFGRSATEDIGILLLNVREDFHRIDAALLRGDHGDETISARAQS